MNITSTLVGVLISILFCCGQGLEAQSTFEFTIKDTLTDQIIEDAIELSTGGYILLCDEVYTGNPPQAQLIRISASGKLLATKVVTQQDKHLGIT